MTELKRLKKLVKVDIECPYEKCGYKFSLTTFYVPKEKSPIKCPICKKRIMWSPNEK
jgi:predicted Zn-ribbon and HTH transcriptional regulator